MKAFLILATALLAAGALSAQATGSTMMKSDSSNADSSMMKSDDSMMISAKTGFYSLEDLGPGVAAFTSEKAAQAMAKAKTVVYFFAATWCPTCQATYKDIKAGYKSLPGDFLLVFVDYDKAKDLKKKYGVTYQHTFVRIGPKGEAKKTWSGTTSLADIVKNAGGMM
jgi:thiol-disulfide isomerase/thioredoxin